MRQIAIACLCAGLLGLGGSASGQDAALVAKGRALAEKHCALCHATGPSDESEHKDAPPLRTLAGKWPLENLEEALAEGIVTGHPDMPAFEFEPPQIEALIEYFQSLLIGAPAQRPRG